jgi:hypothetical protein
LQFDQVLPEVFWHSIVGHINIKDYSILVKNQPLIGTQHPSLSLITFLGLNSAQFEMNMATLTLFWLVFTWYTFSIHLVICVLILRVSFL